MSSKSKYAFPQLGDNGMTLRDYFAAAALQGLMANYGNNDCHPTTTAIACYRLADEMLSVREAA